MILRSQLRQVGRIIKPHGTRGEMSAVFAEDVSPEALRCLVIERDGIMVPFFVDGVRGRGAEAVLLTIDGIDSSEAAATLAGADVYALKDDPGANMVNDENGEGGVYADDLIGYTVMLEPDDTILGEITDVDDRTANYLLLIKRHGSDAEVAVPLADEFVTAIDTDRQTITLDLPEGLLTLND